MNLLRRPRGPGQRAKIHPANFRPGSAAGRPPCPAGAFASFESAPAMPPADMIAAQRLLGTAGGGAVTNRIRLLSPEMKRLLAMASRPAGLAENLAASSPCWLPLNPWSLTATAASSTKSYSELFPRHGPRWPLPPATSIGGLQAGTVPTAGSAAWETHNGNEMAAAMKSVRQQGRRPELQAAGGGIGIMNMAMII